MQNDKRSEFQINDILKSINIIDKLGKIEHNSMSKLVRFTEIGTYLIITIFCEIGITRSELIKLTGLSDRAVDYHIKSLFELDLIEIKHKKLKYPRIDGGPKRRPCYFPNFESFTNFDLKYLKFIKEFLLILCKTLNKV